jgi:acyl-CoA synthetase
MVVVRSTLSVFPEATIAEYTAKGWWTDESIAELVARNANTEPDGYCFLAPDCRLTWREYDRLSSRLAAGLVDAGCEPGTYLAIVLPDGALVHVAFLAAEKAGLIVLGIGPKTGLKEIAFILRTAGADAILAAPGKPGEAGALFSSLTDLVPTLRRDLTLQFTDTDVCLTLAGIEVVLSCEQRSREVIATRAIGPNDLFCVNSTSGTTGVPKCVMQTMNIWKYFGPLASDAGEFSASEIFMSLLPAPFGFGLWSAHVVPTMLARPTVLLERFDVHEALRSIERERVTVLAAVSSQFVLMLNAADTAQYDLSSLRVLFTGGERVPADRAADFETRFGCSVLQFFGSNEAGPISVTRVSDTRAHRLSTSGRTIAEMNLRLIDAAGVDVTVSGGPGQCACRGPGLTPGYLNDPEANQALFRPDGWLMTGDFAVLDEHGYLSVVGRVSDLIIRGGHNVSALMIEDELTTHPRIAQVAAVAAPDATLGERVCVYVVLRPGASAAQAPFTIADIQSHLGANGVSKSDWPELLVLVDELPVAPGGKVRKAELRDDIARRLAMADAIDDLVTT